MDPILFESLGEDPTPLPPTTGGGRVGVTGYGYESLAGGGIGFGQVAVRQNNEAPEPTAPNFGTGTGRIGVAQSYSYGPLQLPAGTGNTRIPVAGFGYEGAEYGGGRIGIDSYGQGFTDDDPSPPPTFAEDSISITERLLGAESIKSRETARVSQIMAIRQDIDTSADAKNRMSESASFETALDAVYYILVSGGISVASAATATPIALQRVVERMLLLGLVDSEADALTAITESLAAAAAAEAISRESITESAAIAAAVDAAFLGASKIIESLSVSTLEQNTATMVAGVRESAAVSEALASSLEAFNAIRDGMAFVIHLSLDSGEFIAWSIGTQNKQLSSYTNFPFNSFAKLGDTYLGANQEGIFDLSGQDDDGDDIAARLRGAMTDLGDGAMKRNPVAYVSYSAPNGLIFKTITTENEEGDKVAHYYRLKAQPANATRKARMKLGHGVKSVFWGWEVENVDGGEINLTAMEFVPIIMARRMVGKNGGNS